MQVVFDTNIVISYVLAPKGPIDEILQYWRQEKFDLLVSETILDEYQEVLSRPHIQVRHKRGEKEVSDIIARFRRLSVSVNPKDSLPVVHEDPDDNKFIECAVEGKAHYIVSGDPHLLALREYQGICILPPAHFLVVLKEELANKAV